VNKGKKTILVVIIALAVAAIIAGILIVRSNSANKDGMLLKLDYQTILPSGKTITNLGGWQRVSPPESDPVYAYTDTIKGVSVSVSQQPLPDSFKDDADTQVTDLAKKFNATAQIDSDGVIVYIGTSAKGPQSVIFTKNDLLILIKSQQKISDTDWANYIASLT